MLRIQGLSTLSTNFKSDQSKDENSDDVRILHNNLKSSFNQTVQKSMSAVVDYPVKGLMGDINTNFYEFLTMGIVPYIAGSAMFMLVDYILENICCPQGLTFDCEGSMIEGVARFYRGFGAEEQPYAQISRCRPQWVVKLLHR